jgi:hypothetical protein
MVALWFAQGVPLKPRSNHLRGFLFVTVRDVCAHSRIARCASAMIAFVSAWLKLRCLKARLIEPHPTTSAGCLSDTT